MYLAINIHTKESFEFTWLPDNNLVINSNIVNENDFVIVEVEDTIVDFKSTIKNNFTN